eukprot:m51a1_g6830 hypothetical protein (240) ;mRNA; f:41012-42267
MITNNFLCFVVLLALSACALAAVEKVDQGGWIHYPYRCDNASAAGTWGTFDLGSCNDSQPECVGYPVAANETLPPTCTRCGNGAVSYGEQCELSQRYCTRHLPAVTVHEDRPLAFRRALEMAEVLKESCIGPMLDAVDVSPAVMLLQSERTPMVVLRVDGGNYCDLELCSCAEGSPAQAAVDDALVAGVSGQLTTQSYGFGEVALVNATRSTERAAISMTLVPVQHPFLGARTPLQRMG